MFTLVKVTTGTQSLGLMLGKAQGQVQEQTNPTLHIILPGKYEVARMATETCRLPATQKGLEISILPSASGLQERASSRSRAVDGSMVKIQSFLGKIEDVISNVTDTKAFTLLS